MAHKIYYINSNMRTNGTDKNRKVCERRTVRKRKKDSSAIKCSKIGKQPEVGAWASVGLAEIESGGGCKRRRGEQKKIIFF